MPLLLDGLPQNTKCWELVSLVFQGARLSDQRGNSFERSTQQFKNGIKWHVGEDTERVKVEFYAKGFPNCYGAIDGTHLPMELPLGENNANYFDYN